MTLADAVELTVQRGAVHTPARPSTRAVDPPPPPLAAGRTVTSARFGASLSPPDGI